MWDVNDSSTPKFVRDCAEMSEPIFSLTMSSDESLLAIGCETTLAVFAVDTFRHKATFRDSFFGMIRSVAFINNTKIVSVSHDGMIKLWAL